MIEERGKVVAVKDDWAWVETERKTVCGQCAANK
ncbi:MAG: SoxR reducing system RseC family protein, partial [Gammaproteobacteria bacterium]